MNDESKGNCWYLSRNLLILIGIILVLVGYSFMNTIIDMEYRWSTQWRNTDMAT